jgi:hypothetical protein
MIELITPRARADMRLQQLVTVSALSLMAVTAPQAKAEDSDRPTVWIELGGQLERISGTGDRILAPFMTLTPTPDPYKFASPADAVRPPRYALGEEGKITFDPKGTSWVFSAALRYGRSNGDKTAKHQTDFPVYTCVSVDACHRQAAFAFSPFAKTFAKHSESDLVLDFMAGKDVGLGMFGRHGSGVVSAGVRFAQFSSKSDTKVYARPYASVYNKYPHPRPSGFPFLPAVNYRAYTQFANSHRSFHGIGPSISWEASSAIAGEADGTMLDLDWGANAAILFGRQRATTYHYTAGTHFHYGLFGGPAVTTPLYPPKGGIPVSRSRSVIVPNVGGFAAISLKFPNAKVSLGYRGDFFFGANDAGIDVRKEDTLSFHGPFATISVGLGG